MTLKPRYTPEQVIQAIEQSGGIKAEAARRLQCNRSMILYYMRRWPEVAEAFENARQDLLDLAESRLIARVERDEWPAVRFVLVTLGKERGYSERAEVAAVSGGAGDGLAEFQAALDKVYGAHDTHE